MMRLRFSFGLLAFLLPLAAHAYDPGLGNGGSSHTTNAPETVNNYAIITATLSGGGTVVNVTRGSDVSGVDGKEAQYANGDLVILWQFSGSGAATTLDNSTPSDITGSSTGHWEWARVSSTSNTTHTISLQSAVGSAYSANVSQIVRVPEYNNVTVNNGGLISPAPFTSTDGGGIVAFLATGSVSVHSGGTISADGSLQSNGAGWNGGAIGSGTGYSCAGTDPSGNLGSPNGAAKGQGVGGGSSSGRGNVLNAAGGGDCQQAGGGGGANGGKGGGGGVDSGGGTRGGIGGQALTFSVIDHLAMGGGGGAGNQFATTGNPLSNIDATSGGSGGGVIMFRADSLSISAGGLISANGANAPGNTGVAGNDGQGGGGGGGTISVRLVHAASPCTGTGTLTANGGNGHSSATASMGPGGGGGGGHIFIQSNDATCTSVTAAANTAGGTHGLDGSSSSRNSLSGDNGVIEIVTKIDSGYCTADSDCNGNATRTHCDVAFGVCKECLTSDSFNGNSDCGNLSKPTCSANELCTTCGAGTDCQGHAGHLACNTGTGACVACVDNTTCTNKSCNTSTNTCVNCNGTTQLCTGSPAGNDCDTGPGNCVVCTSDVTCGGIDPNNPSCKVSNHTCEACTAAPFTGTDNGCSDYSTTKKCKPNGTCVQCLSKADCTDPNNPVCNGSNQCTTCSGDADCSNFPDSPICDGSSHHCRACSQIVSGDCQSLSLNTPVCNIDGSCSACGSTADCEAIDTTTPFCSGSGACLSCSGNDTRCDQATRPICEGNGSCGKCANTGECSVRSPNTPVCHLDGSCQACGGNADCETNVAATTPVCNGGGSCTGCAQTDANCTVSASRPACQSNGSCNACRLPGTFGGGDTGALTQCDATKPVCAAAGTCSTTCDSLGAAGETLCSARFSKHCEATSASTFKGQCVQCRASGSTKESSDCNGDVNHPLCDYSQDKCVTCTSSVSNSQPSGEQACTDNFGPSKPHCGVASGACVNCNSSNDCGSATAPVCSSNTCGGCSNPDNSECLKFGSTAFCNVSNGHCNGCIVDTDCQLPTAPQCNALIGGDKACGNCSSDTACTHFNDGGVSGTPACQIDDGIVQAPGQCKQCSKDDTSLCTGSTSACNFETGLCQLCTFNFDDLGAQTAGCASNANGHACIAIAASRTNVKCGCNTDADCGSTTSGRICNTLNNTCVDGCSRANGRNDCPAAQFCTSDDLTGTVTGVCTATCNFDSDCASVTGMTFCINATADGGVPDAGIIGVSADGGVGRCAGCRDDNDCSGTTPVCEPQKKICVQCTDTRLAECTAASTGAACLTDETCGCTQDSDCGATDSGRICDLTGTHKCKAGCHIMGGNGCPSGLICNGSGTTPGDCVVPMDLAMNITDQSVEPLDMSVPVDMTQSQKFSLRGGGLGCAVVNGSMDSTSLGALLLLGLALAALQLRRRRAR
jgi:hypothetical protein